LMPAGIPAARKPRAVATPPAMVVSVAVIYDSAVGR
jgi:hypothetical protein